MTSRRTHQRTQGINNTLKENIATLNPSNKPKETTATHHITREVAGSVNAA